MPSTVVHGQGADFESWLAAREPALHRLATLLTGDPVAGHALLRPVLARLYLGWDELGADDPEGHARTLLLEEHRTTWDHRTSDQATIRVADDHDSADAAAWALVGSLPPRERAVVVVRHHEQLDDAEAARVLRLPTAVVRAEDREVTTALRLALDRQRVRHPERTWPGDPAAVLAETLRAHADDAAYLASDPVQVRDDAARLGSRRRRTTALVTVAAVTVVVGLVALLDPLSSQPPQPGARPTEAAPTGVLQLRQAGGPPRVPYLIANVLVGADGAHWTLPVAHPRSATLFRGDLWVTELYHDGDDTLLRLDAAGTEVGRWPTSGDPVIGRGGRRFAWVEVKESRSLIHLGRQTQSVGEPVWLVGLLGRRVVYNGTRAGGAWVTDPAAGARRIPGLALARGVDPITGAVSGTSETGEGVVVDSTGELRWRSPLWRPEAFSPDGRHVVAFSAGRGAPRHVILDAHTGREVATVNDSETGPALLDLRWEDDSHVLALVTEQGRSALRRVDLTGAVVNAAPPLPGDEVGGSAYQFAQR